MNAVINVDFTNEGIDGVITEPVTLDEAKTWLRVDGTTDDDIITMLIKGAREDVEKYLNMSLIPRTVTATIVNENGGQLLPYGPVPDTVTVKDADGNTVDTDNVKIIGGKFKYLELPISDQLTVSYDTIGYTSSTVPAAVKTGILQEVAYRYEHRGEEYTASMCKQCRATLRNERAMNNMFL